MREGDADTREGDTDPCKGDADPREGDVDQDGNQRQKTGICVERNTEMHVQIHYDEHFHVAACVIMGQVSTVSQESGQYNLNLTSIVLCWV